MAGALRKQAFASAAALGMAIATALPGIRPAHGSVSDGRSQEAAEAGQIGMETRVTYDKKEYTATMMLIYSSRKEELFVGCRPIITAKDSPEVEVSQKLYKEITGDKGIAPYLEAACGLDMMFNIINDMQRQSHGNRAERGAVMAKAKENNIPEKLSELLIKALIESKFIEAQGSGFLAVAGKAKNK